MELLAVLADPVRRDILVRLKRGPMTAGEIAAGFAISRPAISRHLRVLRDAGLVSVEVVGRTRRYRFEPAPLAEIDRWLAPLRDVWSPRLDALETEVYRTRRERRRTGTDPITGTTIGGTTIGGTTDSDTTDSDTAGGTPGQEKSA